MARYYLQPKVFLTFQFKILLFVCREKQSPPSLNAQKHPHGTSPSKDTHPHTGQPRPFTYGNDNSSVNRQSRVQTTRPDPIPGMQVISRSLETGIINVHNNFVM